MAYRKNMKVTANDYSLLKQMMWSTAKAKNITKKNIHNAELAGLTVENLAWQLFRASKYYKAYLNGYYEAGYNDSHISTALISIFKDLALIIMKRGKL